MCKSCATVRPLAASDAVEHHGKLPGDDRVLLELSGIWPMCANLVLAIACSGLPIPVDMHVHEITNCKVKRTS